MREFGVFLAHQFWDDALSQHLAQLDAPLVKRIDVPDNALREDRMLIEGQEFAEGFRRETVHKNGGRRAVAFKDSMRYPPIRRALIFDLLFGLAEGQGLRLCKNVSQQHVVMPANRVERLAE